MSCGLVWGWFCFLLVLLSSVFSRHGFSLHSVKFDKVLAVMYEMFKRPRFILWSPVDDFWLSWSVVSNYLCTI